jgi:HD superfamily phosphodiesterase
MMAGCRSLSGGGDLVCWESKPEPELLYAAALFHDTGLVRPYRGSIQRFELDSADAAASFLKRSHVSEAEADNRKSARQRADARHEV